MKYRRQNRRRVGAAVITLGVVLFLAWRWIPALDAAPASPETHFAFTVVGDYGKTANTDAVLNGIAASGAQFNLAIGDFSYANPAVYSEADWCNYVQSHVGATFPFELLAGNHDADNSGNGHINNFAACLPDRIGSLTGTYGKEYFFDYQNLARFIFVSPGLTMDGTTYTYSSGSARYLWLSQAIDDARAAKIPWVIVSTHKNCISTGVKNCEIGSDLFNLLISKKVDLVLQGHDHLYERTKQLAFSADCPTLVPDSYNAACVVDDGADNAYAQGAGMTLVVVGTGGQSLYASNVADSEVGYFARMVDTSIDAARYGFLRVGVTASQLSAQFVPVSAGTFTDSFTITSLSPPQTTTLISTGAAWKYLADGSDRGTVWRDAGFDDSAWASGNAELGYGDGDEATTIGYGPDANNKYVTTYFRKTFFVANPALVSSLTLYLLRDDGAVVYLNGTQIMRSNMPAGEIAYNTRAATTISGADEMLYVPFTFIQNGLRKNGRRVPALTNGVNVLAVEVHQAYVTSTDVSFDLSLTASTSMALSSFRARSIAGPRVKLKWTTTDETNVTGFTVWRSSRLGGTYEKLNAAPIQAKLAGQTSGAQYTLRDKKVVPGKKYLYRLQALRSDVSEEWSTIRKVKVP